MLPQRCMTGAGRLQALASRESGNCSTVAEQAAPMDALADEGAFVFDNRMAGYGADA